MSQLSLNSTMKKQLHIQPSNVSEPYDSKIGTAVKNSSVCLMK